MIDPFRHRGFIVLTFVMAFMLDILPLPGWAIWFRPTWTLLVLIYWALALPLVINVATAFLVGIVLDLLQGTLLGEHAFAMIVIVYMVVKLHQIIRMYPMLQQTLVVFSLVLFYQFLIYVFQGAIGELPHTLLYWLPCIVAAILWPWVFIILRDFRRRLGLAFKI